MPENDRSAAINPPLLEVSGLTTRFSTDSSAVHAVEDVSFSLAAGETLGVVGESGCGKSITGLSILRLVPRPHGHIVAGSVKLEGRDLLVLSERQMGDVRGREVSMVFQDPMTSLNPILTVGRQIGESMERHLGLTVRQARDRAIDLLRLVGIPNAETRVDLYPHHFSGGMRQRVVIAMALSCNPKLIIADEPTTALDVTVQAQILELFRDVQHEFDSGVMMITHSMGVVAGVADRVQVMYAGRIVETATTDEIFANPRHPYTVGLQRSIPKLDERDRRRLEPIGGLPPDLAALGPGCAFAPRCRFARQKCLEAQPPMHAVGTGHATACWFWEEVSMDAHMGREVVQ